MIKLPNKTIALKKVTKVIFSCETLEQMIMANDMITAYDKMYKDYGTLKHLDNIFNMHCDRLRKLDAAN